MLPFINALAREYDRLFAMPVWVVGTGVSIVAFVFACAVNQVAGEYATMLAPIGRSISDVILDAVPRVDTALVHEQAFMMSLVAFALLALVPRLFPLALLSATAVIITRAVFINMTHLGMYEDAVRITGSFTTFGGDLFFSGHVAVPFALALVFWDVRPARYLFFFFSFFFGAAALLGHYHYSIDIFAAPFIAYGLYHALRSMFPALAVLADRRS